MGGRPVRCHKEAERSGREEERGDSFSVEFGAGRRVGFRSMEGGFGEGKQQHRKRGADSKARTRGEARNPCKGK